MRIFIATLLSLLIFASPAIADRDIIEVTPELTGTGVTSYYLASGVAEYTDGIIIEPNVGYASVNFDLTSGSDLDVTFEVSNDGSTWFIPRNTSKASLGSVVTNLTEDGWIDFTPTASKFIRFKLDPDADSKCSMEFSYAKETP